MQSMKNIKRFAIPVLVLTGIIVFIACTLSKNTQAAADEIKAEQEAVKFIANAAYVKASNLENQIPIRGQVETRNIFTLYSEADGKVAHSSITVGRKVKQGETLLTLDASIRITNLKMQEQGLRKAQLDNEIAQKNYDRFKALFQNGNASSIDYENAKAQLDATEIQLRTAEQQLESIKIQVRQTSVLAPTNGVIIDKKVNKGDYVQPGTPLGTIAENILIVKCFVPENIALSSKLGDAVTIKADALPNQKISGTIKSIVPYPNEAKLYPIDIDIQNPQMLIAGLGVQVFFSKTNHQQALFIPRAALTGDFKNPSVYVVDTQKKPTSRSIKTGKSIGNDIEVLEGLQEGELVIVSGQGNIEPGKVLADFKIVK